ncbi:MAG: DUF6538 domain-containing protein, partial [Myxococcota bacterium]|nr:DUF6538 domain-containing protein [Myxococcota bacterium]
MDLVDVLGRTEITRTLQTSNHAIALERAAEVEAVLVKEFRALRSKEHTDAVELEAKLTALAEQYREELILTDRAGRRTFAPILDGDSDIAGLGGVLSEESEKLERHDTAHVREDIEALLARLPLDVLKVSTRRLRAARAELADLTTKQLGRA